jgi:hypothetical protein
MQWVVLAFSILIFCFGYVLLFGAPYVPTLKEQMVIALDFLDLKPGETMLELGSGDGKVLLSAAQRGWKAVGYELNPILYVVSIIRTWRYRRQVKVVLGNFWTKKWPPAEGIFTFILGRQMEKLDSKVKKLPHRPIKLTSFAFQIPGKDPVKENKGIYLYRYNR